MQIKKNELHKSVRTEGENLVIGPADWLPNTDPDLLEDYPFYKDIALAGLKHTDQLVVTYTGRNRTLAKECMLDYIEARDNLIRVFCAEIPVENISATLTVIKK